MLRLSALVLIAALAGCTGSRPEAVPLGMDGTPIVAAWSADTLTLAEFDAEFAAADGALADTVQTPMERRIDFLDRYVDFRLKVLSARQLGYDQDSAYVAEVADYRDQLAGPYFTDRQVLDGIVRDIYDKQAEEVETSHVLFLLSPAETDTVAVYARAASLRDSITAGQITFAEAARQYSQDPSAARPAGQPGADGALGYLTGGRTVLPFEDAAYATPVGQISAPVRTQFGVHLVQVTDRRAARGEIGARHILIRTDETVTPDSARAVIEGLQARVLAGDDFADLAREYSQDPGSGVQGGDLGTFGRGRMVPPFEEAAFELAAVGDLSEPVESRFGVHLIQLTSISDRPGFDEAYPAIRQQALRLPRTALRRQAIGREVFEEAGGTYDAALVREAILQYGTDQAQPRIMSEGFGSYSDRVFASLGDSTYVLADLVPTFRQMRPGLPHPEGQMIEAARAFADEKGAERALAGLEDSDPEFARVFRSYADGVLLFRIAEDSVWTPAKDDLAGLRAVYDARPGAYRWPERRRVLAFRAATDSLLLAVGADITAGRSASAALTDRADVRMDTLFVTDSTGTALDRVLGLRVGGQTGIVTERGRRSLYVFDGIEAPRDKTFEEARAELISVYQDQVEDAWEARLRERYNARTYPERVPASSSVAPSQTLGLTTVGSQ